MMTNLPHIPFFGLEMRRALVALQWAKYGIDVACICSTFNHTGLKEVSSPNRDCVRLITNKVTPGRVGKVRDIVGAVVYLAGDAAALISVTSRLIVDGWTAA